MEQLHFSLQSSRQNKSNNTVFSDVTATVGIKNLLQPHEAR
jgi:hypothetical protein